MLITLAGAAAAKAAGEAEAAGLPQLDPTWWPSQIVWLIITFGGLYLLMSGRFLPALGGVIEERRDRIADDLDQASAHRDDAAAAETAYNTSLADARAKAQAIAAETRSAVDEEIAEMQRETDEKLAGEIASAETSIAAMKAEASSKVETAAIDLTRAVVEQLIDEAPTEETAQKAVARVVG